jgi:hypothetical protein
LPQQHRLAGWGLDVWRRALAENVSVLASDEACLCTAAAALVLSFVCCSFFRNPLGSVPFLQKLVQKEQSQDPTAAAAVPGGSRPGSAIGHERAPYELDSEEEEAAAAAGADSEEEGPSREPSGFFRAFQNNRASHGSRQPHAQPHGSRGHTAAASAVASSAPSVVCEVGAAGGQGQVPAAAVAAGGGGTPRGHASIAAVEAAGHNARASAAGGGEAGRGLL